MIPASLRRVLEPRLAGAGVEITTIWRDGSVLREVKGRVVELESIPALPHSFPATSDDPFPHD
jgi:hypothetical protein